MILIDIPIWAAHGTVFAHLVSDASFEELHDFAARVGVPRGAFDGDHYDVPERRYAACVAAGATPVTGVELARRVNGHRLGGLIVAHPRPRHGRGSHDRSGPQQELPAGAFDPAWFLGLPWRAPRARGECRRMRCSGAG